MAEMIKVKVQAIGFDVYSNSPVVLLATPEHEGELLPLWIGNTEAIMITTKLQHAQYGRPLTVDLIAKTVELVGGEVKLVQIHKFKDSTYFARIILMVA